MGGFETVPYELEAAARFAEEAGATLGARLAALRGEVDDLLGARWRGVAADGFARSWDAWGSAAASTVERLQAMAHVLRATGVGYRDAEAASMVTV